LVIARPAWPVPALEGWAKKPTCIPCGLNTAPVLDHTGA
jgi:hypothetical protein